MRTLANILWHFPFMGFLNALGTFLIGGLFVITIVGAPIGLGLIELSRFLLTPFSSNMINKRDLKIKQNVLWNAYGFMVRIIYFPFGLILAIVTVLQIIGLFVSILGIPLAIVLAKSLSTFFNPVNKVCVDRAVAYEVASRKARERMGKY
jgi:uncharacterized membrane protein YccF (DUF307 family)